MDFDDTQFNQPTEPQEPILPNLPRAAPCAAPPPQRPRTSGWRIFWTIVSVLSIMANVFLFFVIIVLLSVIVSAPRQIFDSKDGFAEQTLVKGPASAKIAVIRLEGIIDNLQSDKVSKQLEAAANDASVKAVIIRVISPGGTVSASDRIHSDITRFRKETSKPVVAFMQSVAASGGYYTSVACDKIIAEPTTITGSIGVIMSNLVIKDLLESKLGIEPVVIKSGPKKDWPSMFSETSEEQKQYLFDKLINPAYNRFVNLVVEGRQSMLTRDEVMRLADGSIYGAEEALEERLIDGVGYFDDVVDLVKKTIQATDVRVIEYVRQFSITHLLGAETRHRKLIDADQNTLHELAVPQLMYLWDVRW